MHYVGRASGRALESPGEYEGHSARYQRAVLIDGACGAVHSHLTLNVLAPDGGIGVHMHSFEEGFYVLEGEALVVIDDETLHVRPGDFAAVKAGTRHGWRAIGADPVRWLQIATPQPKVKGPERDTFFAADGTVRGTGVPVTPGAHRALVGHFDPAQIPPPGAPRPGVAALPGVFLQWLIDEAFGARHHRLLFIEYQPGVGIGLHDHTFEETYFVLSGEIEAVLDGQVYVARAGDVIWTGVGCVHTFTNRSEAPVRWLETFAPQPPAENVFRFFAEWDARGAAIEKG